MISALIGNILMRAFLGAETPSEILTVSWWVLIMDAIDILAAILAILVVRNIDLRQENKNQLLTAHITV